MEQTNLATKPSHTQAILNYLREHGGSATLGELLDAGRFSFAHKLTARISDLRKQGFNITCEEKDSPTRNIYRLEEKIPFQFEVSGQGLLVCPSPLQRGVCERVNRSSKKDESVNCEIMQVLWLVPLCF